jgi:hypothetical protein
MCWCSRKVTCDVLGVIFRQKRQALDTAKRNEIVVVLCQSNCSRKVDLCLDRCSPCTFPVRPSRQLAKTERKVSLLILFGKLTSHRDAWRACSGCISAPKAAAKMHGGCSVHSWTGHSAWSESAQVPRVVGPHSTILAFLPLPHHFQRPAPSLGL